MGRRAHVRGVCSVATGRCGGPSALAACRGGGFASSWGCDGLALCVRVVTRTRVVVCVYMTSVGRGAAPACVHVWMGAC